MDRGEYHVCILILRFQPLVYRPLCEGEQPVFSRAQRCLYHVRIHVIFATLGYYYLLINVNSPNYICRIRAIWRILLTIVDYW